MDRAHRIGQKKEVQVFRFCIENSIEEKVRATGATPSRTRGRGRTPSPHLAAQSALCPSCRRTSPHQHDDMAPPP